jgi:benzylsuccinate CoA-transferase BbsF subunit
MASPIYAGVCILELGTGAAGASATRDFAEQGATVIRIESPLPDDVGGESARARLAAGQHHIALDLRTRKGIELMLRFVERADVLVEGLAPGGLAQLGLAPERLRQHKPDLVLVSVSLFGQSGPQRHMPGRDAEAAAIAAFAHLRAWADRAPVGAGDPLWPRYVALLVAAALLARQRRGRGQSLDVSRVEAGVYSLAEWVVRWTAQSEARLRDGNRDAEAAPHGIYPCRGDTWIAIAVSDDEEWDSLLAAMGDPGWAAQPRFASQASRLRHADEIDAGIAAWTRDFAPFELMAGLQATGVPAGVVQHDNALRQDPQLAHRGHFVRLRNAASGSEFVERAGFRLDDAASPDLVAGEAREGDIDALLRALLGLDAQEVAALRASGALAC